MEKRRAPIVRLKSTSELPHQEMKIIRRATRRPRRVRPAQQLEAQLLRA